MKRNLEVLLTSFHISLRNRLCLDWVQMAKLRIVIFIVEW